MPAPRDHPARGDDDIDINDNNLNDNNGARTDDFDDWSYYDDDLPRYLDDRATRVLVVLLVGAAIVIGATVFLIARH